MADHFGALVLPAPPPAARPDLPTNLTAAQASLTDPCLDTVISFCASVLNDQLNPAWAARSPAGQKNQVAKISPLYLSTNDPREGDFVDSRLPGLFLFRSTVEETSLYGADFPATTELLKLLWVFPADAKHKERARNNIINGLVKVLVQAFEQGRHPSWVIASDQADADAIMLAVPTSTSSQIYIGAALNGAIGSGNTPTPRPVTVKTSAVVGAYNVTDPIVVTGTLFTGETGFVDTISLASANGGETRATIWNFASVQSIAAPAQLLATGQFEFGYGASPEAAYGSPVRRYATLKQLRCSGARRTDLIIPVKGGDPIRYDMVEFDLRVQEHFRIDYDAMDNLDDATDGAGLYVAYLHEDGSTFSEAAYE